jgi:uncharacterized protein YciI
MTTERILFAVIRQEGAGWDRDRPLREQDGWPEHARYMDALADEGVVVLAGPIGDGTPLHRALVIFAADDEATVQARLDEDPWTPMQTLTTVSVERWNLLLGRLPARRADPC